jgi:pimeloyl-ACP methyl ester carboxylesterase
MKFKQCVPPNARSAALFVATLLCASAAFAAATPKQHTVTVDGHPIAVWSKAASRPKHAILLVHGRTWGAIPNFDLQVPERRSVMESLVKHGFAAYAVDLRGYGKTPRNADGWSTPNQAANDLSEVLKWIAARHPRLHKPALLGWSNGSIVAHLLAQQSPDVLSDLILYGYPRDPAATPNIPPTPAVPPREINTRGRAASDFISPKVTSPGLIETYVTEALKADPVRADWKQLEEYRALDPAKVKVPTLVLHGERDPLAPIAAQSRLFVGLGNPDKQWVILAGGDHAAMLEDTHEAFIAAIVNFVGRPRLEK